MFGFGSALILYYNSMTHSNKFEGVLEMQIPNIKEKAAQRFIRHDSTKVSYSLSKMSSYKLCIKTWPWLIPANTEEILFQVVGIKLSNLKNKKTKLTINSKSPARREKNIMENMVCI